MSLVPFAIFYLSGVILAAVFLAVGIALYFAVHDGLGD